MGGCQSFTGLSWEASTFRIEFLCKLTVLVNGGRKMRSLSQQQAAQTVCRPHAPQHQAWQEPQERARGLVFLQSPRATANLTQRNLGVSLAV